MGKPNAKDVLPPELLEEVQKYHSGDLYIPTAKRAPWGSKNGTRRENRRHEQKIRAARREGKSYEEIGMIENYEPESIKNICSKKEGNEMNTGKNKLKKALEEKGQEMDLNEIVNQYSDIVPLNILSVSEFKEGVIWFDVLFTEEDRVIFPDRSFILHICSSTPEVIDRLIDQDWAAQAYEDAGCKVCRFVQNKKGEKFFRVIYKEQDCIVFAEEYRENALCSLNNAIKGEDGRFLHDDELLTLMAKVGDRHLIGNQLYSEVLFDSDSCFFPSFSEDWIEEYMKEDLCRWIPEDDTVLKELLGKIRDAVARVRDALRPMHETLPRSVFHGEDNALLDENGHLLGLCDFAEGGSNVCASHFLRVAMEMTEMLPKGYMWEALRDPKINEKRVGQLIHSMKVIGKEYRWTEEELVALPLIYRLLLFYETFEVGMPVDVLADREKSMEMLTSMLDRLTSEDEIDFRAILTEH